MMRRMFALAATAVAMLAACNGTGAEPVRLEFSPVRLEVSSTPDPLQPPRAVAGGGVIRVLGYFQAPCNADELRASAKRSDATIRVRVESFTLGSCPDLPRSFTYEARLRGLEQGSYRIVVEHRRDLLHPGGAVLDSTVALAD